MDTETPGWTDVVPVSPQCGRTWQQYMRLFAKFHATMPQEDYKVHKIYRIQNLDFWHKYQKYVSADYESFLSVH